VTSAVEPGGRARDAPRIATISGTLASLMFALVLPIAFPSNYVLSVATTALVFVALSAAFNLVFGYTGLMSLGQVGLFGIGGYTAALLVVDLNVPHLVAFAVAAMTAALVALILGYPTLRLSPGAFAIATLSFSLLLQLLAGDLEEITRGQQGIPGLPAPVIVSPLGDLAFDSPIKYYYLMLAFAVGVLALIHRLVHSRIGRTLVAIRLNEDLAESQGIPVIRYKLLAFVAAAVVTGLAGALHVFQLTIVHPSIFDFSFMQAMLIMVMVGGPGSFWGVLAASALFAAVPELLRVAEDLRLIIYGLILIATVIVLPQGVAGLAARRFRRQIPSPIS
jgi:branched-chain amino acid transport system permease protein